MVSGAPDGQQDTDGLFVNGGRGVLERPAHVEHSAHDPAVAAYKDVFRKGAMEGPGKTVSNIEAHADSVEGKGPDVGKSVGKVEGVGKTVGKSEEDSVGKFEGKGRDVGKVEGVGKSLGKSEEGTVGKGRDVGKSVGKVEGVGKSVGKSEEGSVGKSVGKSEGGKSVGKTEGETVGKAVGKADNQAVGKNTETGKVEGDSGKVSGKSVRKAEGDVRKASHKSLGKGEEGDVGKSGGESENQAMGKISDSKEFVIVVAGKSEAEVGVVESLFADGELKLPEGATLAAYGQAVATEDGFRVDIFMDQITSRQFGRLLLYAHQLPSTHTLLSQNCKALPVGTLSVADVQFQGKGRAGNSWESPKGCLMFSFTLQMSDGRAVPFLQYVVSLAVIEGIESHSTSKGLKAPEVRIKWPNDLYAKGLKVGGVLCTSTYSAKKFHIVVGVGLNVGNRQPTTCLEALLEEINEEAPGLSKDELLAAIISKFENLFEVFSSQGFFALESDYYKRWLHSGQTVVLEESQEGSSEVSHVPLKIQGLTPSGYLRAEDDASETYELHPDGNSFDFLKGLVRKKM